MSIRNPLTPTSLHRLARPVALAAVLVGLASVAGVAMAQPADGAAGAGPRHAGLHRMGSGAGDPVAARHAAPGMRGMGGMGGLGALPERELDAVGASAEQKSRLREIQRAAHDDLRRQHQDTRALRQQMQQLLAAPQPDADAAEALRQKLHAQHDAASKRMLQAALASGQVLTPEQRQKLAERRKQHHDLMLRHRQEREALHPPRS